MKSLVSSVFLVSLFFQSITLAGTSSSVVIGGACEQSLKASTSTPTSTLTSTPTLSPATETDFASPQALGSRSPFNRQRAEFRFDLRRGSSKDIYATFLTLAMSNQHATREGVSPYFDPYLLSGLVSNQHHLIDQMKHHSEIKRFIYKEIQLFRRARPSTADAVSFENKLAYAISLQPRMQNNLTYLDQWHRAKGNFDLNAFLVRVMELRKLIRWATQGEELHALMGGSGPVHRLTVYQQELILNDALSKPKTELEGPLSALRSEVQNSESHAQAVEIVAQYLRHKFPPSTP